MKPCPTEREADVLLLVLGELNPIRMPKAAWHWITCAECRSSAKRMRRVATRLGRTATPLRVWATRATTLVAAAATLGGMWVLGQKAVDAAMEAMERPKFQNANYETEPERGLPMRPN